MGRDVVNFLQILLDNQHSLIQVGMATRWTATSLPSGDKYLDLDGSVVAKDDFPRLWEYAQGDSAYTTTATTITLPTVANFIVKARE